MDGSGVLSALDNLAAERGGGFSGLAWERVDAKGRAAILDLLGRDVANFSEVQLGRFGTMPLFQYEEAGKKASEAGGGGLDASGCGPLSGDETRRWTKVRPLNGASVYRSAPCRPPV